MCGIAGIVEQGSLDALAAMTRIQEHRGPDDHGLWSRSHERGPAVYLGSRRLAILDLSPAGHMPMVSADGNTVIVFNGEIYNYLALRARLEAEGCRFTSNSDTEVILHLYERDGAACVGALNGIFAFAIWDEARQQLLLARDHFGVKPLYYHQSGRALAFASEAKALFAVPEVQARLNEAALRRYLAFLWVPEPETLFAGVWKLPAGHIAIWRAGELKLERFWDLAFPPAAASTSVSREELTEEVRRRFLATVRAQLQSDVPLGAFLSAGIDSSSIVAAMAQASPRPVRTFTIDFPDHAKRGELMDDGDVAKRTAAALGCRHTHLLVEPDVAGLLPKLIWHMDDPVADPAIITAYLVAREARQSVTVLLSGAGGDEIFGGYRKYVAHELAARYRRLPAALRLRVIEPGVERLPSFAGTPLRSPVRLAQKFVRSGSLPPEERFVQDSIYMTAARQDALFTPEWRARTDGQDPRAHHLDQFKPVSDADFLNQMLYVDTRTFLPSLNLNYVDKMSMATSVEARVPFLDHEFASWVACEVPPSFKIDGRRTKAILRDAMAPLLPAEALNQPKAGFGAPVDHWVRNDLGPMLDDLLSAASVRARGIFAPDAVRRLLDEHIRGRHEHGYRIWALLTLEIWMRTFLD